jgi:hypothetical protein
MVTLEVVEAICGAIAIYVGVRWMLTRTIRVVSEGGFKPLALIEGRDAVVVGCVVFCVGLGLIAASFGLISLL